MRTGKILGVVAAGLVLIVVVGFLAVWLLVNPNAYKGKIAAAVKESTGRELILGGDISLSLLPRIALKLGPASLGNPAGFGDEPFLKFNRASVRVKLLPLLHQQLEMAGVELDGLDLRMRKNAEGKGNWEGFGSKSQATPAASTPTNFGQALHNLAGIQVTNGRVSYETIIIDKFNFETGSLTNDGVIPVKLGFNGDLGKPGETASVDAKFALRSDATGEDIKIEALSLSGLASLPGEQPAHWEFSAPSIVVNLTRQTLQVPAFAAAYLSARVNGQLAGTKIIDAPSMTGSVTLAPVVLRELMPRVGMPVPKTRDPRALSQLSASSEFAYDAKGTRLDKILVHLDDTKLQGHVALLSGDPSTLQFELAADRIDANRYLPPAEVANAQAKAAEQPSATAGKAPDKAKPMQIDGTLGLASLHFSNMSFTSMRLTVASKDNVMRLFPTQAVIFGGRYSGDITLDNRTAVPAFSLDEHLADVDMAQLLADTKAKGRLSGKGNVNLKATARGAAAEAIEKSLNGHFDANLANGALEGVDIAFELARATSLIEKKGLPAGSSSGHTKFDAFKMSAQITNGVASTKDLTISSPVLRVTGQGSANIPTKGIDFAVLATILKSPTATVADIPMKITGTYVDPTVRPDLEALAKGQVRQKLQNVLQDKLKGLFGK